jgi:hypothetical protein
MKRFSSLGTPSRLTLAMMACMVLAPAALSQQVTFAPYIQLGDNGPFGTTDQIVIAWQTDEVTPNASAYNVEYTEAAHAPRFVAPQARVVDNYLAADPSLPAIPGAYGAHSNYTAVLRGLKFDTEYDYKVTGPGLPDGIFTSHFRTRKQGPVFSFVVEGDEGYFPVVPNAVPATIIDYEARIAHLVFEAANIQLANENPRPAPDFILNTGDNVYTEGTEDNYRDFFFPVYNNNESSNETGGPILRSTLFFPADGNHDLGSTGVSANLLADNSAPRFSGNLSGGDALSYFNDFYFPQNGPAGFDIQYAWNYNTSTPSGFTFTYQGQTYNSPAAIQAFRNSTIVNTGQREKAQIDHQSNYSFDYGTAHVLFLDANPHIFNDNLPSGNAYNTAPPVFTAYPPELLKFVINDLDSSTQPWKIVVFHQPAFSSGDATIVNNQMRAIAKVLEDHGVNMVFNGHEHNYQRTYPLLATDRTAGPVSTTSGTPAVIADTNFDGRTRLVPDGVLYMVEGAGGNRDFDGDDAPPRGSGLGLDQDDAATGTFTDEPGLTVPQGPESWLDTNLTNREMVNFLPNAGKGQKITTKFKSKVFSFGDVLVDHNELTLYQISEPLLSTSSATAADPAPYGTDINGKPLNDPIPDTEVDPATGEVVSSPATGTSVLLDKWTVQKPDITTSATATLSAPAKVQAGENLTYTLQIKTTQYPLAGTQVRFVLPAGVTYAGVLNNNTTLQGNVVVVSVGHLALGAEKTVSIPVSVPAGPERTLVAQATVTSSTALSVTSNKAGTRVIQ